MDNISDTIDLMIAQKVRREGINVIHIEGIADDILNHFTEFTDWLGKNACSFYYNDTVHWTFQDKDGIDTLTTKSIYQYWINNIK